MEKIKPKELTKQQILNNHIVLMRKSVRQARVHIINQQTKEIRKLKERKGEEKEVEKAHKKADRLLSEIRTIKHLNFDKVSISALQNKLTLQEALQSSEEIEDRCIAKLANHKVVQKQVLKYREENPLWELQIPVLLEKSHEKAKKKKKKSEPSHVKPKLKTKLNLDPKEEKDIQSPITSDSESITLNKSDSVSADSTFKAKKELKEKKKNNKAANETIKLDKTVGTIKIKQLSEDLSNLETDFIPASANESEDQNKVKEVKKRPKSSFFVGGVDIPEEKTFEKKVENRKPSNFKAKISAGEPQRQLFKKGKLISKPFPRERTPRYFDKQEFSTNKSSRNQIHNKVEIQGPQLTEKLHPSWEAKKRQQSALTAAFQGKKIKFDED